MKQPQRDRVMADFRSGKTEILIATDVAARGIDVDDVDVVFNYDLPQDEEYYVHQNRQEPDVPEERVLLYHLFPAKKHIS